MAAYQISIKSEDAMREFGRHLGLRLQAGDTLLLDGPIGAGKTFLARAIILARLSRAEHVPSPTYTLVQTYVPETGPEIWHADLYRLSDSSELIELGLDDAMEREIVIIEWPDRLPKELHPAGAIRVDFALDGETRTLSISHWSDGLDKVMKGFAHA